MLIKIGLFLALWYEVAIELGVGAKLAFVLTLLVIGGALMLLRMPAQVLAVVGPRVVVVALPVLVWVSLAWWTFPVGFGSYPALFLLGGAALMLAGAGLRYGVTRYRREFSALEPRLRASVGPAMSLLLGVLNAVAAPLMTVAAAALVIGLPLRLGWQLIGPIPPERFDARMGDDGGFQRKGMSDEL